MYSTLLYRILILYRVTKKIEFCNKNVLDILNGTFDCEKYRIGVCT